VTTLASTSQALAAHRAARERFPRRAAAACLAALALAVLVIETWPGAQAALEFDRAAVAAGQWWRLASGNLVHHGWGHLAADLAAFILLCWMAPGRLRYTVLLAVLAALAVGVSACLWGGADTYRGLSGINYGLLAYALVAMAVRRRGWPAAGLVALLLVVIAKTAIETATGRLLVNVCLPDGVLVVGVAHLAGLAVGIAAALLANNKGDIRAAVNVSP